jgi:hypothetical protein
MEVSVRVPMIVVVLCALAVPTAYGTTPYVRQIECAVGGEEFSFTDTHSSSSFGQRPDGKPYSNWDYPLPVCPGNGLVMYREFTADEVVRLPALLQSAQFTEIGAIGQPYYTASFIERSLSPQSLQATWLLLQASWRVDHDAALRTRFQQEFVSAAQAAVFDPANEESVVLRLRMANALRELGRFEEAEAAFASLSTASIEGAEGLAAYVVVLQRVNARRDTIAEPLDAIPQLAAASLCLQHEGAPGWDAAGLCRETELAAEVERIRENRRAWEESNERE